MIQVAIDGKSLDPGELEFHLQDDPYPGGHQYELCVVDSEFNTEISKRLGGGPKSDLSCRDASFVFSMLRWLTTSERANSKAKYFLNTVDLIDTVEHKTIINGRCSPALGTSATESRRTNR